MPPPGSAAAFPSPGAGMDTEELGGAGGERGHTELARAGTHGAPCVQILAAARSQIRCKAKQWQ